jgi:hypothetical protein
MSFLLNGELEVSIFIDDNEYPLTALNLLNWLHISTTMRHALPTFGLQITDVQHVFDNIGLLDGTPIRIVIKPNGKDSRTYSFRKYNHNRVLTGDAYTWTLFGYWDAPLYWAASSVRAIQGTANNVLQEIASTCGLKFDGSVTNDSQIWVPRNRVYRTWAKDIVDHSWVSDNSCMSLCVDLDGTMRLKDLNNLPDPTKKILGYGYADDAYTAVDVQASANSGLNNALSGYQNMRVAQSVTTDDTWQIIKDLNFTPDVKSPLYNRDLRDQLGRGAVRFSPIDAGNVHDNYEKASYQNTRYRNLFSFGLEALMVDSTEMKIGERVALSLQTESTSQDAPNSGTYTITGHAIYTQGANYSEKLGMVRHGTNETPQ